MPTAVPGHVHRRGDEDPANPGPHAAEIPGSRNASLAKPANPKQPPIPRRFRCLKPCQAQAAGAMAARHDVGKTHRGDERENQNARHGEHLLDADPDAHRDAHHRLSFDPWHQSFWARPRRDSRRRREIEKALSDLPNTRSVFAERTTGGYFLDFSRNREAAARYGLTVGDVNDIIETAIGGKTITTTVEGRERYPISVRYARDFREDLERSSACSSHADRRRKCRFRCWPTSLSNRPAVDSQ